MTTVEHAIPIPQLYDDVLTLYAYSGTGYTPTHVVNYGGALGKRLYGPRVIYPMILSMCFALTIPFAIY
jgi:hypothetical protein